MPITIPKPNLLIPKVPSVLVAGLLVAQFLFFQVGHGPEPKCTLNVERPHYSTSLKETQSIEAIKLNVTSICNIPQKYTRITARIQRIENNREIIASNFVSRVALANPKLPKTANFRNLFTVCKPGIAVAYKGIAEGYVLLENDKKVAVTGNSGKYEVANCAIGAQ